MAIPGEGWLPSFNEWRDGWRNRNRGWCHSVGCHNRTEPGETYCGDCIFSRNVLKGACGEDALAVWKTRPITGELPAVLPGRPIFTQPWLDHRCHWCCRILAEDTGVGGDGVRAVPPTLMARDEETGTPIAYECDTHYIQRLRLLCMSYDVHPRFPILPFTNPADYADPSHDDEPWDQTDEPRLQEPKDWHGPAA